MSIMETLEPLAIKLKGLDEQVRMLNSQVEELKSEREKVSEEIISHMQAAGIETSIGLPGGGFVKMDTQVYPSVANLEAFQSWANEHLVVLPAMTFNANTLQAWWNEQMDNNAPIPPKEVVSTFIKTRAKVTKNG